MSRFSTSTFAVALALACGCSVGDEGSIESEAGHPDQAAGYRRINLVSDQVNVGARRVDPDLVNGWGIATGEGGFWLAAEATGKVVIYDGNGKPARGEYISGAIDLGEGITGVAANSTTGFQLQSGTECCVPAQFIFASMGGKLFAVNGDIDAKHGFAVVDRPGSAYFGVAIAMANREPRLYAADFGNRRIDVFDGDFNLLDIPDAFVDATLSRGFSPFNVMAIGNRVFVLYAQMEISDEGPEEMPGPGLGAVSVFDTSGKFLRRLHTAGPLNAPWGLALAPPGFGPFANTLLVGNFGDGRINAFNPNTGRFFGALTDRKGRPIEIDGLWGMTFGDGDEAGFENVLYFAAGPGDEEHGLFGRIEFATPRPTVGPHFDPGGGIFDR